MKASICETCGAAISATSAEGLCGACLFQSFGLDAAGSGLPEAGPVLRFFGDYELLEEVARGGMGVVYRARQVSLNRTVAVKLLASTGDGSRGFAERFKIEAEAAAGLDHPNIVPVYEFGQYADQPFLAMRYITDGRSLSGAKLSPRATAEIMVKTAQAMHYAHQRGVLHRDLKPANILLDEAGEPLVSDFGLAKLMEADSGLTRSVEMMGTPAYMPPEQASGKLSLVTTSADVYGLGAVFYELLTGRPPFTGESSLEIIRKVADDAPVRPSAVVRTVDRDLETICLKCLEKEPAKRYASALALAGDLQRWLRHEPIRARPAGTAERLWKWARRHPAIAAVSAITLLAVTVIAVGSTIFSLRLQSSARENRRQIIQLHQLTAEQMVNDGESYTGLLHLAGAIRLEEQDAQGSARVLRSYFQSIVRQNPSPEHTWCHDAAVNTGVFSADGKRVAAGGADGFVRLYDTGSGALLQAMKHGSGVSRVMFSADGTRVISYSDQKSSLAAWDARTGTRTGWLDQGCEGFAVHPDGSRGMVMTTVRAVECNAASGAVLRTLADGPATGAAYQPDGTRMALGVRDGGGKYVIRILEAQTGAVLGQTLPEDFPLRDLAFSRSGSLLMARSEVATGVRGLRRVMVWKPDAPHEPRMTFRDGVHTTGTAVFDATGSQLVHCGSSGNVIFLDPLTVETRNANFLDARTMKTDRVLPLGHPATLATYSADDGLLLTATSTGAARIWSPARLERRPTTLWHSSAVTVATFSPDGDRVLTGGLDGTLRLYRIPAEGGATAAIGHHHEGKRADIVSLGVAGPDEMYSFSRPGILRRWNPRDGTILAEYNHFTSLLDPVLCPAQKTLLLMENGRRITAVSVTSGEVRGRINTGEQIKSLEVVAGAATAPLVIACGPIPDTDAGTARSLLLQWAAPVVKTGNAPGHVAVIYDFLTGQPVCRPLPHPGKIHAAAFSPDAHRVVTGCDDGSARMWDITTGELVGTLPHPSIVYSVGWSPDGRFILTASGSRWNSRHLAQLLPAVAGGNKAPAWQVGHESEITQLAFSPDGHYIALGSRDGELRLIDAATGGRIGPSLLLQTRPDSIAFSPDSRYLAIAGNGQGPCLLDTATGRQMAVPMLHPMPLRTVAFSADSRTLATGCNDSFVRLWPLEVATTSVSELQRTAELLSNQSLDGNAVRRLTAKEMQQRWEQKTGNSRFGKEF